MLLRSHRGLKNIQIFYTSYLKLKDDNAPPINYDLLIYRWKNELVRRFYFLNLILLLVSILVSRYTDYRYVYKRLCS